MGLSITEDLSISKVLTLRGTIKVQSEFATSEALKLREVITVSGLLRIQELLSRRKLY